MQRHCSEDKLHTAVVWRRELSEVLQPGSGRISLLCLCSHCLAQSHSAFDNNNSGGIPESVNLKSLEFSSS